ncbi:MFS transporter [Micromonospora eburnea]|uniref:Drug resistance transporter, EmrB/QacA subfamily n=1 Tax=Micromonospora eburnea TaxID=227316 RepID=A0A1C6UH55_9ACTN|nr:MFS transporter [Micromonospora eburnea]SCL53400.1 drug resistance transporter, EmrB/QacA subfamily [Micromonospora eburnea]
MARQWKVLLVTSVAVMMALLDVTIVNVAMPALGTAFPDSSLNDLSWVLNAYNVVFAAVLIPAGRLADRWGRRRVFLAGVVLFLVGSAACGLAPGVGVLIAARCVQALGAAAIMPTSLGLLLPEFPVARRATAIALWTATGTVAGAAGPSVGGALVAWQGWRWVFLVNLVIGLPGLLAAVRVLRETRDTTPGPFPDVVGSLLLGGGIGALALAVIRLPDWGATSAAFGGTLAAGAALLVALAVRSGRHPAPIIEPALVRIRSFSVANLGSLVFAAAMNALLLCNVLFLTQVWHYDSLATGGALTAGPVAAAALAPLVGRLGDRFGPRAVALPGGLFFCAGALLLARAPAEPNFVADFLPAALLLGAGAAFSFPGFGHAAFAEFPRTRFATGVAISSCLRQVGAVLGVAVLITVLADGGDTSPAVFHRAYQVIAAGGLLAAGVALTLGRVRARDVAHVPAARPAGGAVAGSSTTRR